MGKSEVIVGGVTSGGVPTNMLVESDGTVRVALGAGGGNVNVNIHDSNGLDLASDQGGGTYTPAGQHITSAAVFVTAFPTYNNLDVPYPSGADQWWQDGYNTGPNFTLNGFGNGTALATPTAAGAIPVSLEGAASSFGILIAGTVAGAPLPVSLENGLGALDLNAGNYSAQTLRVVVASNQPALPVTGTFWQTTQPVSIAATVATKETRSATPSQSSVAGSATTVSLLASNSNRLGATIFNDSTALLYVKLGATASATSFTARLEPYGYYEVPFNYTGAIDGIWASATGNARITELT